MMNWINIPFKISAFQLPTPKSTYLLYGKIYIVFSDMSEEIRGV